MAWKRVTARVYEYMVEKCQKVRKIAKNVQEIAKNAWKNEKKGQKLSKFLGNF
jgi:hypothetical protein